MHRSKLIRAAMILAVSFPAGAIGQEISPYRVVRNFDQPRSEYVGLVSFVVPGFGQWKERQIDWAVGYSGAALVGLGYSGLTWNSSSELFNGVPREPLLGLQMYQTAGSLSAYHSFRTAVSSRKQTGEYAFLAIEETPWDLLVAPFRFDYLIRPTTLIPLAAFAALFYAVLPAAENEVIVFKNLSAGDIAFSGGTSFLAGTGEEALFRGYLMPLAMKHFQHRWLSNLATAGVFALVHIPWDTKKFFVPWPQFLGGLYLGWISQYRGWTLAEAIFIHTWYDLIVFTAFYAAERKMAYFPLASIQILF